MRHAILIASFLLFAAPFVRAEGPPLFQAAGHAGYRAGGGLEDSANGDDRDLDEGAGFAVALEMRYAKGDDRYFQLWYSRQESEVDDGADQRDVDIEYLHLGGTVPFGNHERIDPYFAAGIGATRFSSPEPGASDRTHFSGSMAVGFAVPLAERVALRFELRSYLTAADTDSAIFCRSDDGSGFCRIVASGSSMFQAEALAGIALRF
ncbi:MAG: outer membrane beta-barrel protein [Steroidobacteraceae bacterium]